MKYKINAEELPEEIEAKSLEEAEKLVLDNIDIQEDEFCMSHSCPLDENGECPRCKEEDNN